MHSPKSVERTFLSLIGIALLMMGGMYFYDRPETSGEETFSSKGSHHRRHNHGKKHGKKSHHCKGHKKDKNCYMEEFQAGIGHSGPVDLLFVLQTSPSIAAEEGQILAQINEFVASLPESSDVNIAVMLAHGSTSELSGRLYRADNEPVVLSGEVLTNSQIQSALTMKFGSAPQDLDSGGGEEGMFSVFRGITTPELLAESQAADFFRDGASLGIVFIGDQRDICAPASSGAPPETDPVKLEARIRDCEGLTPQGLTTRLQQLKGDDEVAVAGIIYADQPVPADGENELGYGYLEMINLNPGFAIDMVQDDISSGLEQFLEELGGDSSLPQNSFTLSHTGVRSATVRVYVNGQSVPFQLQGDVVTVTQSIPPGAKIVIIYCVQDGKKSCKQRYGPKHHGHLCKKGDFFENHKGKGHGKHHPH